MPIPQNESAAAPRLNPVLFLLDGLEDEIGGARKLADCTGRMPWPARGVYFFREEGEVRSDSGSGPRIVRVGTHALKDTSGPKLWKRLSQHGSTYDGHPRKKNGVFDNPHF